MPPNESTEPSLRAENAELRSRIEEAEKMLRAIGGGGVDALVVEGDAGPQAVTLQGRHSGESRVRGEVLAQMIDAVVAMDTEDRVTFLNAAAERQYGVRAGDMLGRQVAELFTQSWAGTDSEAAMRTALRERGEWRGELMHGTRDGRELPVEASIAVLLNPDTGERTGTIVAIRDVTKRQEAEAVLRRNTALFSKIIEQAPGGVYVVDAQFRVTQMNAESLPFFASVQPLIGRDFDEVLGIVWGPEIGPQCASIFRHTLATGERYASPRFSGLRHDIGVEQAFEWETQRITLPDGQHGVMCYFQDVTARERAEAARRESEERLTLAVKCSQVVLFQQDLELRYTWVQNAVPGFDDFVAIGKRDADLMDRAADAAVTEALKREVIRSGASQRQEVLIHIRGVGRHFDLLVEPLRDAAGLITGITGAAIDITGRKQAEEALEKSEKSLRYALQAAAAGVWDWDIRSGDIVWSHENYQLYDVDPAQGPPRYADWGSRLHPEDRDRANESVRAVVEGREAEFRTEFRILNRQGAMRWLLGLGRVEYDGDGQPLRMSGLNLDITERKRAEEALRDSALMLADFDHRKDAFLATLSHELRNPLGVISYSLHLLRLAGQDPDAVQQGCARMQRQVVLMKRLIDDLMDISRINQDKLMLQTELLDLATVARSALENSRTVLDQRGHTVTVVLPPQPIKVDGDATRLAQVVSNLLTNAAKYSDPDSAIGLTIERQGDVAAVAVRDRGIGIAPVDLPRVFELFAQVSGAAHLAQGGLGIGLNLVKRVVELHGGSVEARSDGLGQGSEFLVRLPLASAGGAAARSRETTKLEVAPQT